MDWVKIRIIVVLVELMLAYQLSRGTMKGRYSKKLITFVKDLDHLDAPSMLVGFKLDVQLEIQYYIF